MRASTDPTATTAKRYRAFAEIEARGMSPRYESWARGVADDAAVLAMIDRLPAPKRQPNLVFSSARLCGAEDGDYPAFAAWVTENWAEIEATCLSHATQTNEPGRCAALLPALAALPAPLALIEVGASAGLCLYPDRYSYRYSDTVRENSVRMLDPAAGRSPVVLDCETSGPVPFPSRLPEVVWRAGIDLNPLDVANERDVEWLEALIWPEHEDRRLRLRAAVGIAREDPVRIVRGDLVEQVEALVARPPAGASIVVFHTAVLAYLDNAAIQRFIETLHRLPVTWLANEGQGVIPGLMERAAALGATPTSSSDFLLSLNGEPIAFTQPHGRALHWL